MTTLITTLNTLMTLVAFLAIVMMLTRIALGQEEEVSESPRRKVAVLTLKTNSIWKNIKNKYNQELEAISSEIENVLDKSSFIAMGYIRWLEKAGLEPIALDINADDNTLLKEIAKFDGLLLTGGNQQFFDASPESGNKISEALKADGVKVLPRIPASYLTKVAKIIDKIKEINDSGRKYPIWATCLGFEAMIIIESHYSLLRHRVDNKIYAPLPVKILNSDSRSINFFDKSDTKTFGSANLFYFNHKWGFLLRKFKKNGFLRRKITPVASITKNNKEILVWFEYSNYPFVGTQFHPEKFERETTFEENDPKGVSVLPKEVNHKIALLFKSLMHPSSLANKDPTFDSEINDARMLLVEIGKYHRIHFYIRDPDQIASK